MNARVLVTAALVLGLLGLFIELVPIAPEPVAVVTSYATSYTTMSP